MKQARLLLAAAVLAILAPACRAQGCALCLDQTRATPPSVQAGYRHAIELMAGFGCGLFAAGAIVLHRNR